MRHRWVRWGVGLVLLAAWWFKGAEWVSKPGTYRLATVFAIVVVASAAFHLQALIRFWRMVRALKYDEALGLAEPGSTLFALNQRFRYLVRTIESLVIAAVAILLFVSVHNPKVARDPNYARLVITYFVGSIAATGYLTVRDLRVINTMRKLAGQDLTVVHPLKEEDPT